MDTNLSDWSAWQPVDGGGQMSESRTEVNGYDATSRVEVDNDGQMTITVTHFACGMVLSDDSIDGNTLIDLQDEAHTRGLEATL